LLSQEDKKKIRNLFHDVRAKIGILPGYLELYYKMPEVKDFASMSQEEILKEHFEMLDKLKSLREHAMESTRILTQLQGVVYEALDIDKSKPI